MEAVEALCSSERKKRNLRSSPTHHTRQTCLVISRSHNLDRAGERMVGYNSAFQTSPALALARGVSDRRSRLGPVPVSLPTKREGCQEKVVTNTFTSRRMGEIKLRMESCLTRRPRSPGTQLLLAFAEVWLDSGRGWAFVRRGAEN